MELTCWDSIKSAPIHLTPIVHPLQLIEAVQFHRHTFQYLLLPIDIEQVASEVGRTKDTWHTERWWLLKWMKWIPPGHHECRANTCGIFRCGGIRGRGSGVPIANILLTFYGWKIHGKTIKRVTGAPASRGRLLHPRTTGPSPSPSTSPSRSPRLEKDGGVAPGVCRATSRLTVWLSFPIYPMRYLRLMCLKVNTMWHRNTHTQLRLRREKRGQRES